jgi:hypothetical protein
MIATTVVALHTTDFPKIDFPTAECVLTSPYASRSAAFRSGFNGAVGVSAVAASAS